MRSLHYVLMVALIASCGGGDTPRSTVGGTDIDTLTQGTDVVAWSGYYEGTLPCSDCKGITTRLWVRSDSSFVLLKSYHDRDTVAATLANWSVTDGQLELYDRMHVIGRLLPVGSGLEWLDDGAGGPASDAEHNLVRKGDEQTAVMPIMHLSGTFNYFADAMSFRPCGMERNWPCAGGREWTEEGKRIGSVGTVELQNSYLKAVQKGGDPWVIEVECSLATGPAMEGDGTDEYIFIHRVLRSSEPGQCP